MRIAKKTLAATAGLLTILGTGPAFSAAIERNLPPAPLQQGPAPVIPPNSVPQALDTVPLGPNLTGLVVLGPKDEVVKGSVSGVDTSRVAELKDPAAIAQLQTHLGKPLTRRAIAEVEATIANIYRAKGLPFVAVLTPPQEVTSGVVQFRVVEFTVGKVTASGNTRAASEFYTDRVRVKPGEKVQSGPLIEDLDWINRSNFHKAEAIFTPGAGAAQTDLDLRVNEGKPWRVYAGYANSGAPSTTRDRYFAGAMVGDVLIPDSFLSYQITGSRDFWYNQGGFFKTTSHPDYISNAVRLVVPTAPRQQLEFLFSSVESSRRVDVFDFRQSTDEGSIAYRSALSNLVPAFRGDIYGGLESAHQLKETYFLGSHELSQSVDLYQLFVGWTGGFVTPAGDTELDISLHSSPGSVTPHNDAADFKSFSRNRVSSARYDFVQATVGHTYDIVPGFRFATTIQGQLTTAPLPDSQQLSIAVIRGYSSDDGSFDTGITTRNELQLPGFNILGGVSDIRDRVSPYIFLDAGYARDRFTGASVTPISTGAGFNYGLGNNLSTAVDVAYALRDAIQTERDDLRLEARITISY